MFEQPNSQPTTPDTTNPSLLGDAGQQPPADQQPAPASPPAGDKASLEAALAAAQTPEEKAAAQQALDDFNKANPQGDEAPPLTLESLPDVFDKSSPLAKEYIDLMNAENMPKAEFREKLMALGQKLQADFEEKSARMWLDMNQQFQTETIRRYGGEDKLEPVLAQIGNLIETYDRDELSKFQAANPGKQPDAPFGKSLRQALTLTGFGNHPEAVKFFHWMAGQLGEGAPLSGTPAGGQKTLAQTLFPNQK